VQPAVTEWIADRKLYALVAVLAVWGVAVSAISLQRHFAKSESTYCNFNQTLNCDIVNRSEYSTLEGIPVAAIGVAGYAAIFVLSSFWKSRPGTPTRLLVTSLLGLAFSLYLTYVEAYRLMTWCIFCLSSQVIIFLIAVLSAVIKFRAAKA
jgi:vitamin-K-epoxide reductase (warfarin-sensitive)